MKKLVKLSALLIAITMLFTLTACSYFNEVKTTLEEAGYQIVQNEENNVTQEAEEDERVTNLHVFTNGNSLTALESYKLTTVVVIEFKATKELVEYYKESDTLQGAVTDIKEDGTAEEIYNQLKSAGFAHRNCIIVPIGLDAVTVLNIIKAL